MPTLTLIRGLPGSGKSTWAKALSNFAGVHIEADMFFENEEGEYHFDPKKIGEAHKWCQEMTEEYMDCGLDVYVSNTFTQKWEMEPYLKLAIQYGYDMDILVARGEYNSIHNVPQDVIDRMKSRWED